MRHILNSIWQPRKALLLTFILFIVIEYMFTLIAFTFFHRSYKGNCQSVYQCFFYTFDYTFKLHKGGIGARLDDFHPYKASYEWDEFLFHNLFNIILLVILIKLFAGIIIDTFGYLREKENEKMRDIKDVCFICGNNRETFDKKSAKIGFLAHTQIEHNIWNYVFFIAYLNHKKKLDYNGIEDYVKTLVKAKDISWFPLNKAIALQEVEDSTNVEQVDHMEFIGKNIGSLEKQFVDVDRAWSAIESRVNSKIH
eukprot:TRINITY_DN10501_c0_g1_i8.p1 TRINITY_DN10501_c0_g1~~TRINITY_DN10501_c0_g1_i8.p1  ORF type:complete len:253 (-),score=67.27 TRINITY_DN10501_c0_g1_i8:123-881(-)